MELSYYLPTLGRLNATLHREGEEAYGILAELGQLERMQSTPQLGIVSEAWHGARHTKWEYTLLTLALLQACKSIDQIPTASKVVVGPDLTVSSALALMQVWTLLSPIGHTYWTFTSERALLAAMSDDEKEELLGAMPDPDTRAWAALILDQSHHYRLFHVLTLYRLASLTGSAKRARWQRLMASSHVPSQARESLYRARALYRSVRRLAFLCLDAEYSPSVLSLRLSRVLTDPEAIQRLVLPNDDSADELTSLEVFLSRHVYLGEETLTAAARRQRALVARTSTALESQNLRYAIQQLGTQSFVNGCLKEQLDSVVRLEFEVRYIAGVAAMSRSKILNVANQQREAERWSQDAKADLVVSTEVDASQTIFVIQAHAGPGPADRWAAIAYGQSMLRDVRDAIPRGLPVGVAQFATGGPTHELLKAALTETFGPAYRWRFGRSPGQFQAAFLERSEVEDLIQYQVALGVDAARAHELRSTADYVGRMRNADHIAISLVPVIAVDAETGEDAMELDGLLLYQHRTEKTMHLVLIEAKDQRRGGRGAAHRHLLSKLRKVRPVAYLSNGSVADRSVPDSGHYSFRVLKARYGA